jgi:hypothetical protein
MSTENAFTIRVNATAGTTQREGGFSVSFNSEEQMLKAYHQIRDMVVYQLFLTVHHSRTTPEEQLNAFTIFHNGVEWVITRLRDLPAFATEDEASDAADGIEPPLQCIADIDKLEARIAFLEAENQKLRQTFIEIATKMLKYTDSIATLVEQLDKKP